MNFQMRSQIVCSNRCKVTLSSQMDCLNRFKVLLSEPQYLQYAKSLTHPSKSYSSGRSCPLDSFSTLFHFRKLDLDPRLKYGLIGGLEVILLSSGHRKSRPLPHFSDFLY